MRGFYKLARLGKCTFCNQPIQEDSPKPASKYAKITYGKWICGSCLLGMKDAVDTVIEAYDVIGNPDDDDDSEQMSVDPKTGKLVTYKYPVDIEEPR